jgi:hypothetical protein
MRTTWIAAGLMAAGVVHAEVAENPKVTVCVAASSNSGDFVVARAKQMAGKMFADVGVSIVWRRDDGCPTDALRISFSENTPVTLLPGAAAYALPYEGTHIVVFYDRVRQTVAGGRRVPFLLAHVLVHEITHILQGVNQHSESGVMKAHWDESDYQQMAYKPLGFTPEDVRLIHLSLERRHSQQPLNRGYAPR